MAIYKAKLNAKYAMIPNSSLQDSNLSYEATGLLAMMLSLPSDWEIRKSWLQNQKQRCGRDKLTAMMNELIQNGYVRKEIKQDDAGRLNGVDWLVYPEPTVELENRNTVNPSDGKSDTTNKTSLKKETHYKRFAPPTEEQVFEYMQERDFAHRKEAETFINFYECKGWVVGKSKMKDWKAAVRNWISRSNLPKTSKIQSPQQFDYDHEAARQREIEEFRSMLNG